MGRGVILTSPWGGKDKLHPDPCPCSHSPRGHRARGAPVCPAQVGSRSPNICSSGLASTPRSRFPGVFGGRGQRGPCFGGWQRGRPPHSSSLPSAPSPVLCQAQQVHQVCIAWVDRWTKLPLPKAQALLEGGEDRDAYLAGSA